jgi:hypothetical protein
VTFLGFLFLATVLLLPAVGAYFLSRKTYVVLKKKPGKWALPVAILVFIATYLTTLWAIFFALFNGGLFRR